MPEENDEWEEPASILEPLYNIVDILEAGFFVGAIAVGIWYYSREQKWRKRH